MLECKANTTAETKILPDTKKGVKTSFTADDRSQEKEAAMFHRR